METLKFPDKQGINERDGGIKLWSIAGWLLVALLSLFNFGGVSDEDIKHSFATEFPHRYAEYRDGIIVTRSDKNMSLFVAYEDDGYDWSEIFAVGRIKNNEIEWLKRDGKNNDPIFGIYFGKFIYLQGIDEPVLEVWLPTHRGHGQLRLFKVKGDSLEMILDVQAIDRYQNEGDPSVFSQSSREYNSCGGVYGGEEGRLYASYEDRSGDGVDEVVLTGTEVIKCEKIIGYDEKGYVITKFDEIEKGQIEEVYYLK